MVFDLTHLPGLFITRAFLFKQGQIGINLISFVVFYKYIIGSILGLICCILLVIDDMRSHRKIFVYWFSILLLIIAVCFIKNPQEHYFIPAIIPFWIWISIKRQGNGYLFKILLTVLLIVTSFSNSYNLIFGKMPDDSAYSAQQISSVIATNVDYNKLLNSNIAVLQSSDINSFGLKYRDLLLVNNINIKCKECFETSDNLFVITQNSNLDELRMDPSVQMSYFKNGLVNSQKQISGTGWWVFRFDKY